MEIRPLHTEADYKIALKTISSLMESDPDSGTPEGDQLDVLTTLVQAYEARHYPIDLPDLHKGLGIPAASLIQPTVKA